AEKEKAAILAFYKKNIQRHLYGKSKNILFLSKNAAFCTWLPDLQSIFPEAQFIITIRNPKTSIPAQLNALKPARALFGTDPNGLLTKAIIHQSFQNNYNSIFNFLNSTSKPTCVLIQQEELRNDSIGVLKKSIDQLTIDLEIKSIQQTAPSNHSVNKKNTSAPQDPIDPIITNLYKNIIDLDLSTNR
ncbi:MAG: sulfotransferase, partial [Verrucomicrobia bacterium]|nr:sulfotransferase [Verrucomicrobiota bacterium]